ncbi:MAG: GNAT family N-acetyltransferase [Alphaproteobacteria bacterium]|nr:GNAT family N-acetyltransferase [Alphaproteobacteria bacterium]
MQFPMESGGVRYDLIASGDFAPAATLVAEVFARDEPLAVATGQTREELTAMLSLTGPSALAEQLSIGAASDGRTVGVAFATAFTWLPPDEAVAASPNYAPIGALLEELEAEFGARPREELERCVHVHMLAVDRAHRDRGIGRELLRVCLGNARARGMIAAVSDATNPASRRTFEAAGFTAIGQAHYADFAFEGEKPFAGIATADHTALMFCTL